MILNVREVVGVLDVVDDRIQRLFVALNHRASRSETTEVVVPRREAA